MEMEWRLAGDGGSGAWQSLHIDGGMAIAEVIEPPHLQSSEWYWRVFANEYSREVVARGKAQSAVAATYDAEDAARKHGLTPQTLLSPVEAAGILNVTERRVRKLCEDGRIRGARKIGKQWVIPNPPRVEPASMGPKGRWEEGQPRT